MPNTLSDDTLDQVIEALNGPPVPQGVRPPFAILQRWLADLELELTESQQQRIVKALEDMR